MSRRHRDTPVTRGVVLTVVAILAGVVLAAVFCLPLLMVLGSML
jgi:hypothetical protein